MGKRGPKHKEVNSNAASMAIEAYTTPEVVEAEKDNPYEGLTERQQLIARMRLRGFSQTAMAQVLGVSQPIVSKELKRVREHMSKRGASVDQNLVIGETTSLYEEVERRAWELYHDDEYGDKAKALQLVLQSREKHTKLLMDLGRLEKAGNKITHEVKVSPFLRDFEDRKEEVVEALVNATLTQLPAPVPPEYDDVEDAEMVEDDEDE